MKKKLQLLSVLTALFFASALNTQAQYAWTQETNFPGAARDYGTAFSIGHYGFVGCGAGASYYNDFYKWDQKTNTWSTITPYPGAGYYYTPASFTIEGKGYVGLGYGASGVAGDLWKYDTTTNAWAQMASIPSGYERYAQSVFVVGHKAYIIGGSRGGSPYLNDVWMYDAHQNTWTKKNNPPDSLEGTAAFAIGNHGYMGAGYDYASDFNTFWQYDTTNDRWTSIASIPVPHGVGGSSQVFVLGSKAYLCIGSDGIPNTTNTLSDGYVYDTVTKAWSVFTNMGVNGIERDYAVAFSIGNKGYIATGKDSLGNDLKDLWQYSDTSTLGINEVSQSTSNISIYPNPSNGMMNIVYNGNIQKGELQITDITGRILNSYELVNSKGQMTINESGLSDGIYFYQVIDSENLVSSGKFVITK